MHYTAPLTDCQDDSPKLSLIYKDTVAIWAPCEQWCNFRMVSPAANATNDFSAHKAGISMALDNRISALYQTHTEKSRKNLSKTPILNLFVFHPLKEEQQGREFRCTSSLQDAMIRRDAFYGCGKTRLNMNLSKLRQAAGQGTRLPSPRRVRLALCLL